MTEQMDEARHGNDGPIPKQRNASTEESTTLNDSDSTRNPAPVPPHQANVDDLLDWTISNDVRLFEENFHLNELGFMERFIRSTKGQVLYVPGIGWHIYRDHIWEPDKSNDILSLTSIVAHDLQLEYAGRTLVVTEFEYRTALKQASGSGTRNAVLRLAAADRRMKVLVEQLNSDPLLLSVKNGTLDLRTNEPSLRPGRPTDYITQRANVAFDPEATCPRFDELLRHAFNGDVNMIAYVWRVLGYCLTGLTSEQAFFFLWGVRGSSKTTIAEIMVKLLGTYAGVLDEAALTGSSDHHSTWMVDLLGKRLVIKDELDHRRRFNTARLNTLVSGGVQRGRRMRADFMDIPITSKIMITSNHRPPMGNAQDGVWRRIQPWHFTEPIDDDRRIKDYAQLLASEEGPGILNGCLRGLRDYLGDNYPAEMLGLRSPQSVVDDAEEYRDLEDEQTPFITDVLVNTGDPADWLANADINAVYEQWCKENGVKKEDQLKGGELSKLLVANRFVRKSDKAINRQGNKVTQRGFIGIRFNIETGYLNVTDPVQWVRLRDV